MNARVEVLVEDYNEAREALARTRVEQAETRMRVPGARRRLRAARKLLGRRLGTGRRSLRRRRPGGRLRPEPAGQAVRLGGVRPQLL